MILTNLEYAKDPSTNPLEKRTFARNFQRALVNTINFIRTRRLTETQVIEINFIAKLQANRYIAAGQNEWLYPETSVAKSWRDLRETLLPPADELFHFGGEMYVGYEGGRVHYQDQFGREEEPRPWLTKNLPKASPKNREICPCGSGMKFSHCCKLKPSHLRTSWSEKSIRERNLMFMTGIENLLELNGKDWDDVRSEMTDEKISTLYRIYESLWPRETDLLSLLPKPDGTFRSVYTGSLHPKLIGEFALGSVVYFGEIILQHPFTNPMSLREDMRPTHNPSAYRGEVLKSLLTFVSVFPLVEQGLVHLIPDPWDFDLHLRDQTMSMAETRRSGIRFDRDVDPRLDAVVKEDTQRMFMGLPDEALVSQLAKAPGVNPSISTDDFIAHVREMRRRDPLGVLQDNNIGNGGQLNVLKMAPNFEISMYLAQATGAQILTDSRFRWMELQGALNRRHLGAEPALEKLRTTMLSSPFRFPVGSAPIMTLKSREGFGGVSSALSSAYRYLANTKPGAAKPNFESQLAARFERGKRLADAAIERAQVPHTLGRASSIFRLGGLQDNTVNRLLLMSSSEHHLPSVPMATYISRWPTPDT
ncbi:SEC-C domain-containing protein [Rhizobium sp. BG4]|uniref:SEC-C domain-containing protein n=1 Tax=Rhizobium sp. BG4 TaxID=2613770 RepID=UPI00193CF72A|nr:SEC-C domain-containing protein [Rhizobium sp. BG4]